MIGGLDAIEFFESMWGMLPEADRKKHQERYENALNRFKYEVAKGIGMRKKIHKAVKPWHKDYMTCGKCGYGANAPQERYCPNCGTAYRDEPKTEYMRQKEERYTQMNIEDWMNEITDEQR